MSLNSEFFKRETNITAKIICDSISTNNTRLTTFEVEAPRIILAEINTHNAISKNCSSTRAISLPKAIQQVEENGFTPLYWGKKKEGMSATEEVDDKDFANTLWLDAKEAAIDHVKSLDLGCHLHKQLTGRLLEPFQMVKQVLTATDLDNFFNLRIHNTAQPEILMLAYKMYHALQESKPNVLRAGEWHLPYVEISQDQYDVNDTYYYLWDKDKSGTETDGYQYEIKLTKESAIKISGSCVAQVSYRNTDMSPEKAESIFDRLIQADVLHASVFEHLATPVKPRIDGLGIVRVNCCESNSWEDGITHRNRQGELCSGNLRNWISYRHLLPNNTNWNFDFNERMKLFE